MKLITEYVENDLEVIAEQKGRNGEKTFTIEGVFMQANKKNRNGRIYEKKIMESAVDKYVTEQVQTGRAVGELNHPEGPTVNLDKVSHKITSLKWEGNDVVGKASAPTTLPASVDVASQHVESAVESDEETESQAANS